MSVKRVYVEKKPEFAVEANGVRHDISTLGIKVKSVRLFNRYDVEGIDPETFETASRTIFSEPAVDVTCAELPALQVIFYHGQHPARMRIVHANHQYLHCVFFPSRLWRRAFLNSADFRFHPRHFWRK